MEEKFRPNCNKVDDAYVCPKGVPKVLWKNEYAYEIFSSLLTSSTDSHSGLVKFDNALVNAYSSLFGLGQFEQSQLLVKILFLIAEVNSSIREGQREEAEQLKKDKKV